MKTRDLAYFLVSLLLVILFIIWTIPSKVYHRLDFFWSPTYNIIITISIIAAFIIILLAFLKKIKINKLNNKLKILYGILFLPIALFPALRCYFKIPYIFCKVCPRKCFWGELLPITLPSFLLLNLDKRFWCYKLCPFGTLQDQQCKITKKRICMPRRLINVRYVVLVFTVFVIVGMFFANSKFGFFFKETHHLYAWSLTISLIIFILAFFIPRFWCNYFCPIGSIGDIALKVKNKLKK